MPADLGTLERRALDYARAGNFGNDALQVNRELSQAAPRSEAAWTRLARCQMELGDFEGADASLQAAMAINPGNGIARSLQLEVTKRRAFRPVRSDAASGFTPQDFHDLGALTNADLLIVLGPKLESLLMSLNEQRIATRILDARKKAAQAGTKLFRRNSYYAGTGGHIFAYHHGGRWEPQFNIGLLSASGATPNCLRVGIGFNFSKDGRDPDREGGQERVLRYFQRFQEALSTTWRGHLIDWMEKSAGFIQYGDRPPALDTLPKAGVDWLINCHNAAALGWIFCGRWLFLEKPEDAKVLTEMRMLVTEVEDTFSALYPLWLATYEER